MRAVCFQHDIVEFLRIFNTVFQTKICDVPYPISDLIKNLIPYFSTGAWHVTRMCYKLLWHVHGSWRKH